MKGVYVSANIFEPATLITNNNNNNNNNNKSTLFNKEDNYLPWQLTWQLANCLNLKRKKMQNHLFLVDISRRKEVKSVIVQ